MIALDSKDTWEYIPECDRSLPDDEKTVFILKVLTAKDQAKIEDKLGSVDESGSYKLTLGTQALFMLNVGLVDVKNLKDSKGNEVKLQRSSKLISGIHELEEGFINRIPKDIRTELAKAIKNGYELGDDEVKN